MQFARWNVLTATNACVFCRLPAVCALLLFHNVRFLSTGGTGSVRPITAFFRGNLGVNSKCSVDCTWD